MYALFILLLVLNFLAETMAAVTLIGGPEGITAAGSGNQWSMHYGFAAIAIASASLWVWPQRRRLETVTTVVGILGVFHVGLLTSLSIAGDQAVGVGIHLLLSLLCIVVFSQRKRFCTPAIADAGNTPEQTTA